METVEIGNFEQFLHDSFGSKAVKLPWETSKLAQDLLVHKHQIDVLHGYSSMDVVLKEKLDITLVFG